MRKQKNNKGFSLVELIVVVAIMAVLVGVLAPAYLRYVEKARRQTCYWNMDNVVREVQLRAFSDPEFMDDLLEAVGEAADGNIVGFVDRDTDIEVPTCPSRGDYSITFDTTTGVLEMKCTMEVLRKLARIITEHREQMAAWGQRCTVNSTCLHLRCDRCRSVGIRLHSSVDSVHIVSDD